MTSRLVICEINERLVHRLLTSRKGPAEGFYEGSLSEHLGVFEYDGFLIFSRQEGASPNGQSMPTVASFRARLRSCSGAQ